MYAVPIKLPRVIGFEFTPFRRAVEFGFLLLVLEVHQIYVSLEMTVANPDTTQRAQVVAFRNRSVVALHLKSSSNEQLSNECLAVPRLS